MFESSGSQVFGTTTGLKSGPGILGKSRLIITTLTNELDKLYAVSDYPYKVKQVKRYLIHQDWSF